MLENLSLWHILILLVVLIPFIFSIWAIVITTRDHSVPATATVVWALVMLLFPVVGLVFWAVWWNTRKSSGTSPDS